LLKAPKPFRRASVLLVLIPVIIAFCWLCFYQPIVQDDAYICFRYASNFLSGEGLVYNSGERVEGYTDFLWILLLIFFKKILGVDFLNTARFLGVVGGISIFFLIFMINRRLEGRRPILIFGCVAILLLFNQSLSYWSVAGLETMAFASMAIASLLCEYWRPNLTGPLLIIATLLRPEGALVFFIIMLNRIIVKRRFPIQLFLTYLIPLIPYAIFKLIYYGSILPNPFYAKSGLGIEYIISGLEYFWQFASTLGVFGLIFVPLILAAKRLWKRYSLLYLYVVIYIIYIILIGGDVLKVYRFTIPVVPIIYFLFVISLDEILSSLLKNLSWHRILPSCIMIMIVCIIGVSSFMLSRNHIRAYRNLELGLTEKMQFISRMLRKHMGPNFTVAASTIGVLGYELQGHKVTDMLGLTDSYIAKNPEIIPGLQSTWKERRFNSRYLLQQQPDFIIFSTNDKPSAPAELALFLHSEFRNNYSPTGFLRDKQKDRWAFVYKRWGNIDIGKDIFRSDISFINNFKSGYNFRTARDYKNAVRAFETSRRNLRDDYPLLLFNIGECLYRQKLIDSSLWYFYKAIELDPYNWHARYFLTKIARVYGDTLTETKQRNAILSTSPWIYDNTSTVAGYKVE
jgi:arabinofuranosyltransferase